MKHSGYGTEYGFDAVLENPLRQHELIGALAA